MEALVEVTATKQTRAARQKAGPLKRVHFLSEPTIVQTAHRFFVVLLSDLEENAEELQNFVMQGTSLATPLVLLPPAKPLSGSALQLLALLTSRLAGDEIDPYVAPSVDAVRRMLKAHALGAEKQLVASAELENGMLSVWSCEPKLYRCAATEIPPLAALGSKARERLEVSASGSRIHWPDGDVDLDMDAIREFADPMVRREAEFKYRMEASRYGVAIRSVREAHGLRQTAVPGLSEREVRRLENGEVQPHLETLKRLAKAHGASLSEYMTTLATASKQYPTRSSGKRRRAV